MPRVIDLGLREYAETWELQKRLVADRQADRIEDTLVLVEHPHVITLGRRLNSRANILNAGAIPVVEIERGGDVTYHGPGQLVGYPILKLEGEPSGARRDRGPGPVPRGLPRPIEGEPSGARRDRGPEAVPRGLPRPIERDLHKYLRDLEEALIGVCAHFGLAGARKPGWTGVWLGEKKLASIGIAVRKWVTLHGFALNVSTDLGQFAAIHPCGLDAAVMTSLTEATGRPISLEEVKPITILRLGEVLQRDFSR
jgi:lipoyl(octanoyl) transferase